VHKNVKNVYFAFFIQRLQTFEQSLLSYFHYDENDGCA